MFSYFFGTLFFINTMICQDLFATLMSLNKENLREPNNNNKK